MRIQVRQSPDEEFERFAQGAFDSQIGRLIPYAVEGQSRGLAELIAAEVAPDGTYALLTLEF